MEQQLDKQKQKQIELIMQRQDASTNASDEGGRS